jgi:hypothetical protein
LKLISAVSVPEKKAESSRQRARRPNRRGSEGSLTV